MANRKTTNTKKISVKKSSAKVVDSSANIVPSRGKKTPVKATRKSAVLSVSQKVTTPEKNTSPRVNLKNPRLWVGVVVVVLAVLAYVYKGLFIAAMVNGQPISRFSVISQLEEQNGKQALDNLVVESLVNQEAKKRNIVISQAEVNSEVAKIEDQLKGQGTTLDSALAARGLTRNDLNNQIKLQDELNKMVGASVNVSDADIQKYIDQNQDSLPKDLSDSDLRNQVKQQLEQQALQTKTQAFVADLQKKASITYFVSY